MFYKILSIEKKIIRDQTAAALPVASSRILCSITLPWLEFC